MASHYTLSALTLSLLSQLVFGSSNLTNYSVGFYVSGNVFYYYAGTGDELYFQLCNDDYVVSTNTTVVNGTNVTTQNLGKCLEWYLIEDGMPNTGTWYNFEYNNQENIYPITSIKLLILGTDQFCLGDVRLNGTKYEGSTLDDCIEADDSTDETCAVVDITIDDDGDASFTNTDYDNSVASKTCPYNVSGAYVGPPTPTANGTRTYEIEMEVSSVSLSGTDNDLYLRLCTDQWSTHCTTKCNDTTGECEDDWFVMTGGVDTGDIVNIDWNTEDIGNVTFADIVIFGEDRFCLSYLTVDGEEANAGTTCEGIEADTEGNDNACASMHIDIFDDDNQFDDQFYTAAVDHCAYGINNEEIHESVDTVVLRFKTGSILGCGANFEVYFIMCDADGTAGNYEGHCSDVYKVGAGMTDIGTWYQFNIDITEYDMFDTMFDVNRVDLWAYDTEEWCLGEMEMRGKTSGGNTLYGPMADSGTWAISMETEIGSDNEQADYCAGVAIHPYISHFNEFSDGIDAESGRACRWNDKFNADGSVSLTSVSENESFFDWVTNNWMAVCLTLVGLSAACICGCAFLQKKRKKQIQEQGVVATSGQWHGGNAAL